MGEFVVLTEYFRAEHGGRRKEIAKSIEVNCRIPETKMVVIFMSEDQELPGSIKRALSEENFNKIKIHRVPVGHRSTYGGFFSYANENLEGELCVLCNNDMSFDESLNEITCDEEFDLEGHFISLTRWDLGYDNSLRFKRPARIRKNSQDAWIFKPPVPLKMIEKGGFYMGRPGCDGMVSYLAVISGLKVFNPSLIVHAKHLHLSKHRTYRRKHRMGGDDIYICVYPTDQMGFDPPKLMYKFHKGKTTYGQEAIDMAIKNEEENEVHWNWALEKCRTR